MPVDTAFAPYRLAPGALPEEAARAAKETASEPLLVGATEPLPAPLVNGALADIVAGHAAPGTEPCRAADGSVAGGGGLPRACLSSDRQRARVAEAARSALQAGFAGVCLDRPDAPLALGLLGAGFCSECQRELARQLVREFGDHFQPVDYLALAREAVAQAPGALSVAQLPFGQDFWRMRNEQLLRAVRDHARAARDAARAAARPFDVVAQFEEIGPAQLRAARHLDAAIFPAALSPGQSGIGLARLLRAAMGRRPCALATSPSTAGLARLAAIAATCGVDLSGVEPAGAGGRALAEVRRLSRRLLGNSLAPTAAEPVAECVVLYSAEADLWTGGRHRLAVTRAGELLAGLHVQAPVVTRVADAPAGATLVLADAAAVGPGEAKELRKRLESGGGLLAFGEPLAVDESGHSTGSFLPSGKAGGTKVGHGTLAVLPPLAPEEKTGVAPPEPTAVERALAALLGKGRRAAGIAARVPVLIVLHRTTSAVLVHLVAPEGRAQGATLFVGVHVAGGARRGRFVSAEGTDVRIPMNPSGYSLSTVLPAFQGYAVLSLSS